MQKYVRTIVHKVSTPTAGNSTIKGSSIWREKERKHNLSVDMSATLFIVRMYILTLERT